MQQPSFDPDSRSIQLRKGGTKCLKEFLRELDTFQQQSELQLQCTLNLNTREHLQYSHLQISNTTKHLRKATQLAHGANVQMQKVVSVHDSTLGCVHYQIVQSCWTCVFVVVCVMYHVRVRVCDCRRRGSRGQGQSYLGECRRTVRVCAGANLKLMGGV